MGDDRSILRMKPEVIRCMNCQAAIGENAKSYLGAVVCPECFELASLVHNRGRKELSALLAVLNEAIRAALVEGSLRLDRGTDPPNRRQVLEMIVQMEEANARRRANRDRGIRT